MSSGQPLKYSVAASRSIGAERKLRDQKLCGLAYHRNGAMVVAVIAMRVVQMTIDKIVDVISVGDLFVTAAGAVNMI